MSTTDPATGFTVRNSLSEAEYAAVQAAARDAAQPEPAPLYGDIKQGTRGDLNADAFTTANLGNFAWFEAHKAEILAAHARGELPGQPNHTTTALN